MATQRLGIIMNGVTGRMGMNQHLIRSIVAIRKQGGVALANGDRVMPDPVLIGRSAEKIEALAHARGEFGYWVFEGDLQPTQRPSWNYRAEDGGGIILDMMCHWRYVLDNLFGEVKNICCLGATHIRERWDEQTKPYQATADDAAYAMFELEGGVIATINSSWCVRVRRDDLVTFQVDGTHGSAVAGLSECRSQARVNTPRPVWNPDVRQPLDLYAGWEEVPDTTTYANGFKVQWELFIRHVVEDAPFKWTLREGAKGVQLVECALRSWKERRWVEVPPLPA